MADLIHRETMSRLAHGFGALLEQVQELDKRNAHLEKLLDRMQEQVRQLDQPFQEGKKARDRRRLHSSRSGAALAAVTEQLPTFLTPFNTDPSRIYISDFRC